MAPTFPIAYWQIALTLVAALLSYIITKGFHSRQLFYKLRRQGLVCFHRSFPMVEKSDVWKPMPSWNIVTGNLLAFLPLLKHFPSNAHQNYLITELSKKFIKWDSCFYLDL
jgi:hypothetical protein